MKLCTDCKYYRSGSRTCHARSRVVTETSPYDGKTSRYLRGWKHIDFARGPHGECGPDAKIFEPDDTFMQKVGLVLGAGLVLILVGLVLFSILGGAIWLVVKIVQFGIGQ